MDQWTNGPTDQWTDITTYRDARTHLKTMLQTPILSDLCWVCVCMYTTRTHLCTAGYLLDAPSDPYKSVRPSGDVYFQISNNKANRPMLHPQCFAFWAVRCYFWALRIIWTTLQVLKTFKKCPIAVPISLYHVQQFLTSNDPKYPEIGHFGLF